MRRVTVLFALALVATLWASAIVVAATPRAPRLSAAVYAAGAVVCHQRADRSFHVGGAKLPVCARCFGLYAGAWLGICAWAGTAGLRVAVRERAARLTLSPHLRTALAIMALPTAITVATAWAGVWDPPNITRAMLALPLGAAIGAVVTAVAAGDLR